MSDQTDFETTLEYAGYIGSMNAIIRNLLLNDHMDKSTCAKVFIEIVDKDRCKLPTVVELANRLKQKYNL